MSVKTLQRTIELLVAFAAAIVFSWWLYFGVKNTHWTGTATLVVEFQVNDATTGLPLPGVQIEARHIKHGLDPLPAHAFTVTTDLQGRATHKEHAPHSGTDKPLGLGNTRAAHVPSWSLSATAKGFEPASLPPGFHLKAVPTGPATYQIDVSIALTPQRLK